MESLVGLGRAVRVLYRPRGCCAVPSANGTKYVRYYQAAPIDLFEFGSKLDEVAGRVHSIFGLQI